MRYKSFLPSGVNFGHPALPSEENCRSPLASCIHKEVFSSATAVMRDFPSAQSDLIVEVVVQSIFPATVIDNKNPQLIPHGALVLPIH
jgi:hypothetical protein